MAVSTDLDMVASILKYFSNMSTYVQNALLQGHDSPVNLGFERLVRSMNFTIDNASIPSGKHTKNYRNHHFQWENPLFLWSFSIAMLVITRG